jgi:hypothetical protein
MTENSKLVNINRYILPWGPKFFNRITMATVITTQDNTTYKQKRQTSMPRAGFETAIPATKQPQTYALHRAVTGIGYNNTYIINIIP